MGKSLKELRRDYRIDGVFYTPPELAETLKRYVGFEPKEVYDPTCGGGNLLAVFGDEVRKYGQELHPEALREAESRLVNFHGYCGDTLKSDCFRGKKFECIVANYPFSVKWEPDESDERFSCVPCVPTRGRADYAFLLHILHHLSENGVAVVLCSPGVLFREGREGRLRGWFAENGWIERVVRVPGNTFEDTKVETAILVLRRGCQGDGITFEDLESGEERTVDVGEVEENGFLLSPSRYLAQKGPERMDEADARELDADLRDRFVESLRQTLKLEKMLSGIYGKDFQEFLQRIKDAVKEFEDENSQV